MRDATVPLGFAAFFVGMADAAQIRDIGRRLRLSNKEIDRIAWLLEQLPLVLAAASLPWPRLQRLLIHDGRDELLALLAAMRPADDAGVVRCQSILAQPVEELNPPPLVTGDDLIRSGVRAGRQFSALLEFLRDRQLDREILTPDDAIAAARRWLVEHPGIR